MKIEKVTNPVSGQQQFLCDGRYFTTFSAAQKHRDNNRPVKVTGNVLLRPMDAATLEGGGLEPTTITFKEGLKSLARRPGTKLHLSF